MDFRKGTDKIDVSAYGISSSDQLKAILTAVESDPNDAYFNAYGGGYSHEWQIVGISADSLKASDFKFSTLTGPTANTVKATAKMMMHTDSNTNKNRSSSLLRSVEPSPEYKIRGSAMKEAPNVTRIHIPIVSMRVTRPPELSGAF